MQPIMERLKEKKATVADALGAALDAVFQSTNLTECLEDIVAFLIHKNPQVKEGTIKFLIRCLRTTKTVPAKPEIQQIVESSKKLLSESSEGLRSGGAEALGTVMKIIGERAMNPHMEGLDDIRKNKIKEFFETAEVKAKEKPKAPPPAPKAAPAPKKIVGGGARKAPAKKAAPAAAPRMPSPDPPAAAPAARPGAKAPARLGGIKPTRGRLAGPGGLASPRKTPATAPIMPDDEPEEEPAPPPAAAPRGIRGGLAGRSLAKPATAPIMPPDSPPLPAAPPAPSGFSAIERAELEEYRVANDRLTRLIDDMKQDRSKLLSELQELKNQNAQLIEENTHHVLNLKKSETQLVRAKSDAEATEQVNERLRRELERLKRALSRAEGLGGGSASPVGEREREREREREIKRENMSSPTIEENNYGAASHHRDDLPSRMGYNSNNNAMSYARPPSQASRAPSTGGMNRMSYASNLSEEKEDGSMYGRSRLSPSLGGYGSGNGSAAASGRASPARNYRQMQMPSSNLHQSTEAEDSGHQGGYSDRHDRLGAGSRLGYDRAPASSMDRMGNGGQPQAGVQNWRRAAEVTSQLKARIEQMKANQAFRQ